MARLEFETALRFSQLTGRNHFEAAAWGCLLVPAAAMQDWPAFDRAVHQVRLGVARTGFCAPDLARALERATRLASEAHDVQRAAIASAIAADQHHRLRRSRRRGTGPLPEGSGEVG